MLRGNVRYATCTWHQLVKDVFLFDFFVSQFLKTNQQTTFKNQYHEKTNNNHLNPIVFNPERF